MEYFDQKNRLLNSGAALNGKEYFSKVTFVPCAACTEDAQTVMNWRNDLTTLQMSNNSEPKQWPDFYSEYCTSYLSEDVLPVFGIVDGNRIAFLRFESRPIPFAVPGRCIWLSINIASEWRGQGYGTALLREVVPYLRRQAIDGVVSEVKASNARSRKAFVSAGYRYVKSVTKGQGENSYDVDLFYISTGTPDQ